MIFTAVLVKLKFSEDKLYTPLISCPSKGNYRMLQVQRPATYLVMVPVLLKCDVVIRNEQFSSQQKETLGMITVAELERVRYSLLSPNIIFLFVSNYHLGMQTANMPQSNAKDSLVLHFHSLSLTCPGRAWVSQECSTDPEGSGAVHSQPKARSQMPVKVLLERISAVTTIA